MKNTSIILATAFAASSVWGALPVPQGASFQLGAAITVSAYAGSETLTNFPVLVRIREGSPTGFSYANVVNALTSDKNAIDIGFTDSTGTGLPYDIDTWNPNGESLVWVRLPKMENGTRFAMFWGSTSSGKDLCTDNVWGDYVGVWHLGETADGVTTIHDASTNALSGTSVSSSSAVTDGVVGGSRHITTSEDYGAFDSGIMVDLTDAAKRAAVDGLGTNFTASYWLRLPENPRWSYAITRKNGDSGKAWGVQMAYDDTGMIRLYSAGENDTQNVKPYLNMLKRRNEWHKFDISWKADGTYVIYQDGANKMTGALYNNTRAYQGTKNLGIGGALKKDSGAGNGGRGVKGEMDEVRLRAFVPSDDWAAADYATMTNADFLVFSTAEPSSGEVTIPYVVVADFTLVNPVTGSETFAGATTLALSGVPTVEDADLWQFTEDGDVSALAANGWVASVPSTVTFTSPAADADLVGWLWATNSSDVTFIQRRSASQAIRYTTVAPVVAVQDIATATFAGRAVSLDFGLIDNGTSGGTSAGEGLASLPIPIVGYGIAIVSGPSADTDASPATVTVATAGQYGVRLSVTNEAGNVASADLVWTVTELPGDEIVWNGSQSTDFADLRNWTPNIVPLAGDNVRIPSGTANNLNLPAVDLPASGAFGSFTIQSGATVVALGDTTCVNEAAGGTAAVPYGRGVVISAGSFEINGTLTADLQGFRNGPGTSSVYMIGAGHGGAGAVRKKNEFFLHLPIGKPPYGSALTPTELGSGCSYSTGGGAIKLIASGDISINGTVTASASSKLTASNSSGGSIWIAAGGELSGTGAIRAEGMGGGSDNGGAGGRIRLDCETYSFTGLVSAKGYNDNKKNNPGTPGTLYAPKFFPVGTAENPANVTITNEMAYVFPDDGLTRHWNLSVTAPQAELHAGNLVLHSLSVANGSSVSFAKWNPTAEADMASLVLPDDFTVAAGTFIQLPGAAAMPSFSFDSLTVEPGGILAVGRGDAAFVNEDAGGTAEIPLGRGTTLKCGTATIAGRLSATGMGFGIDINPDNRDGGTAHGGSCEYSNSGGVWRNGYGHFTRPVALGGCRGTDQRSGYGGGSIKLDVAGTLSLSGAVDANSSANSAGAGGSLWIRAGRITGDGTLSAISLDTTRPGAGGRIAVESADWGFSGTLSVDGETHPNNNKNYPGTIFTNCAANAAAIGLADRGPTLVSSYSKEVLNSSILPSWTSENLGGQAFVLSRNVSEWRGSSMAWTEGFTLAKDGQPVANTATYTISGLAANAGAMVSVNGEEEKYYTNADGILSFNADLAMGDNSISVKITSGMILIVR